MVDIDLGRNINWIFQCDSIWNRIEPCMKLSGSTGNEYRDVELAEVTRNFVGRNEVEFPPDFVHNRVEPEHSIGWHGARPRFEV